MLVVSHYPQVPLATTNVATDAARVDNQLKPVIIPPQASTKEHPERPLNPEQERRAEQAQQQGRLLEQKQQQIQQRQQRQSSQQQEQQSSPQQPQQELQKKALVAPEAALRKAFNLIARGPAALQRKDIRLKVGLEAGANLASASQASAAKLASNAPRNESSQYYQQVGLHLRQVYAQQSPVEGEATLSLWV
ncbi:MAG: hypothetical protein ACRDA8_08100 [Shewanella sp.]